MSPARPRPMPSPDNNRNGEGGLSFMPVNQSRSPPHIKKRRAPHACAWCRKRKVRCEPSSRDVVACRRCAREGRRCDFNARRTWDSGGGGDNGSIICSAARSSGPSEVGTPANELPLPMPPSGPSDWGPQYLQNALPSTADIPAEESGQPPRNSDIEDKERPYASNLTQRLISSRLDNEADALDLLTFAASGEPRRANQDSASNDLYDHPSMDTRSMRHGIGDSGSGRSEEEDRLWKNYRLIKLGVLSTTELIEFIEFFFQYLWPLRPIIPVFYTRRSSYILLVAEEPVLTNAILTIASRYHSLSGSHGDIRSERIHWHAWRLLQQNLQASMWGATYTRSLGTITSMLLLTEWHSKAVNYSDALTHADEEIDHTYHPLHAQQSSEPSPMSVTHLTSKQRHGMMSLLESLNIVTPAYRSNKMSWMLVSSAIALAHEACCFDIDSDPSPSFPAHSGSMNDPSSTRTTKSPAKPEVAAANRDWNSILCVFIYLTDEHLASRLGLRPLLSAGAREVVQKRYFKVFTHSVPQGEIWQSFVELIDEMRHVRSRLAYLKTPDQLPLQMSTLVEVLEYAKWRLDRWEQLHLPVKSPSFLGTCLIIEFKFALICSFSMAGSGTGSNSPSALPGLVAFRQAAAQACSDILRLVVDVLRTTQLMRILPVRYWLYITSSALHLLQATVRESLPREETEGNIELIQETVQALRNGSPDDTHMAVRFAKFLEVVLNAVLQSSSGTGREETRAASEQGSQQMPNTIMEDQVILGVSSDLDFHGFNLDNNALFDSLGWWSNIGTESVFP